MTKIELGAKLDAFETALAAYGVSKYSAKEIWELRAEITEDFRSVEFADPAERKDAWQRLQDGMDMLKQKGALLQVENEAFATESEERIEVLQRRIDAAAPELEWTKEELAQLRVAANDIFDFMRQNRWPTRERRVAVWDRFTACRDRIKKLEDDHFARLRSAMQERQQRSATLTAPLKKALEACRPEALLEEVLPALQSLFAILTERGIAINGFDFVEKSIAAGSAAKAPLKLKSDILRELRRVFTEQRAQFSKEDGQEAYALITAVQKEMDAAWAAYKGERQKKADEWVEKQKSFLDLLTEKLQRRAADKVNLQKVIAAKRDFAPKLDQRLQNQQDYLNMLYNDLEELKVKHDTARNFDMRERMEAAMESKKERIAEVDADIRSLEQRIEINAKDIVEIQEKVGRIDSALSELTQKVAEVKQRMEKGK